MRFQGNVVQNLTAAARSNDEILMKELLIDAMVNIIETQPKEMAKTLRYSNIKASDTASKEDLIRLASYNLYNNPIFQKNLAVTLVMGDDATKSDYASAEGSGGEGGGGGNIVASIADMIGSISKWGASNQDLKAEEERTRGQMYEKIFGQEKKTNWMPIVVVGGVLIIGAIVVWRMTAKK